MSEINGKTKPAETRRTVALSRAKASAIRDSQSVDGTRAIWARYDWRELNLASTACTLRHWRD